MYEDILSKKKLLNDIKKVIEDKDKVISVYQNIILEENLHSPEFVKMTNASMLLAKQEKMEQLHKKVELEKDISNSMMGIGKEIKDGLICMNQDVVDYLKDVNVRANLDNLGKLISDLYIYLGDIKNLYEILKDEKNNPNPINRNENNQNLQISQKSDSSSEALISQIQNPFKKNNSGKILPEHKYFSDYVKHDGNKCFTHLFKDHLSDIKKVVDYYNNDKVAAFNYLRDNHSLLMNLNTFRSLCSQYGIK